MGLCADDAFLLRVFGVQFGHSLINTWTLADVEFLIQGHEPAQSNFAAQIALRIANLCRTIVVKISCLSDRI